MFFMVSRNEDELQIRNFRVGQYITVRGSQALMPVCLMDCLVK